MELYGQFFVARVCSGNCVCVPAAGAPVLLLFNVAALYFAVRTFSVLSICDSCVFAWCVFAWILGCVDDFGDGDGLRV